jgi:hypothetical protein
MTTEEVELIDWKVIRKDDELSQDSEANLNSSEHTMYHLNADEHIAEDSDWDVAIDLESTHEATVYNDGRIAFAKAENQIDEDILAHGAVIDVGEEIMSQLVSYLEDDADNLEEMGEDYIRVNQPPRLNAFKDNQRGSVPVEDTNVVGVQTEEANIAERYHNSFPKSAKDVISFASKCYVNTLKSTEPEKYFMEDEEAQGSYNVKIPELPD